MSTNIFKSNNCFIGCEDSTQKEAFYTGIRTGSILSTVQTSSFDVSINRTRGKQLGSSRYAVNSSIRHPDVNLSFNYIQSWPYINEALVNFADLNDVETSSDEAVPQVFSF